MSIEKYNILWLKDFLGKWLCTKCPRNETSGNTHFWLLVQVTILHKKCLSGQQETLDVTGYLGQHDGMMKQRDMMRVLATRHGSNENRIITGYARAERQGRVGRRSNRYDLTPERYARALWRDAVRKDWL